MSGGLFACSTGLDDYPGPKESLKSYHTERVIAVAETATATHSVTFVADNPMAGPSRLRMEIPAGYRRRTFTDRIRGGGRRTRRTFRNAGRRISRGWNDVRLNTARDWRESGGFFRFVKNRFRSFGQWIGRRAKDVGRIANRGLGYAARGVSGLFTSTLGVTFLVTMAVALAGIGIYRVMESWDRNVHVRAVSASHGEGWTKPPSDLNNIDTIADFIIAEERFAAPDDEVVEGELVSTTTDKTVEEKDLRPIFTIDGEEVNSLVIDTILTGDDEQDKTTLIGALNSMSEEEVATCWAICRTEFADQKKMDRASYYGGREMAIGHYIIDARQLAARTPAQFAGEMANNAKQGEKLSKGKFRFGASSPYFKQGLRDEAERIKALIQADLAPTEPTSTDA